MAVVQLHDIVTEADKAAVLTLRRGPGQERYLGSMESHFEDAVTDARACPRMWSVHDGDQLVGFVMISDGITVDNPDYVGPYYVWRLLIDTKHQGLGYGTAALHLVCEHVRTRPDARVLLVSHVVGPTSPVTFYQPYGFQLTGDVQDGEPILALDLYST